MTPEEYEECKQAILVTGVKQGDLQIGEGWYPLLLGLIKELNRVNPNFSGSNIIQAKQKFGGLRVYLDRAMTPEEEEVMQKAEYEADNTCEWCSGLGYRGNLNTGWIVIICQTCLAEKNKARKK